MKIDFYKTIYFVHGTMNDVYDLNAPFAGHLFDYTSQQGYIGETYLLDNKKIDHIKIDKLNDLCKILKFPDATLNRLTKATNYDYLRDGCYTMKPVFCHPNTLYFVPKHWVTNCPAENIVIHIDEDIRTFSKRFVGMFTAEYICSTGIQMTDRILSISDITIISVEN